MEICIRKEIGRQASEKKQLSPDRNREGHQKRNSYLLIETGRDVLEKKQEDRHQKRNSYLRIETGRDIRKETVISG